MYLSRIITAYLKVILKESSLVAEKLILKENVVGLGAHSDRRGALCVPTDLKTW